MNKVSSKHAIIRTEKQAQNQEANAPRPWVAAACLCFFPLIYLLGQAVRLWLG